MSGRKGMKHYPESFMQQIKREHDTGVSMRALKKKILHYFFTQSNHGVVFVQR